MAPKLASALCYFPLLALLFLLLPPYSRNRTVRFHAFQCIGLVIATSLLGLVLGLITAAVQESAPAEAENFEVMIGLVMLGALFVFPIAATVAFCEKRLTVPLVGYVAEKLA